MTYVDFILILILLLAAISGFKNGLIKEITSLAAWVLGIFLAVKLTKVFVPFINPSVIHSSSIAKIVVFAIIFFVVVILVNIVGKLLEAFFEELELGFLIRLGGLVISIFKNVFILSLIMVILHLSILKWNWPSPEIREKSILYQPIESVAPTVFVYLKSSGDNE